MTSKKNIWLTGPYIIWIIGFITSPILTIFYYAFTTPEKRFTLNNIINAVTDTANLKALGLTFLLAASATLICLLLAYPLAICLTKLKLKRKNFFVYLFVLPVFMNFMLQMIAVNVIIENNGIINSFLSALGLPTLKIASTFAAILIGTVYIYFPFMLLPIYNTVSRIDKDYLNASKDLGANGFKTFFKVMLPLTMPGVVSGATMVFVPAISDFAIAEMLGGGKIMLVGNIVEMSFTKGHYYQGSGLALLLMVFVLISSLIPTDDSKAEGGAFII